MSTNTAAIPQRVAIILNGPSNWDEWIEIVKTKTIEDEIWSYVDFSMEKTALSFFTRSTIPRSVNVNSQKAAFSLLSKDEKKELKLLWYDYKHQLATYKQQNAALSNLQIYIQETISRIYLFYVFKCETSYNMLIALKQRLLPTDQAHEVKLI